MIELNTQQIAEVSGGQSFQIQGRCLSNSYDAGPARYEAVTVTPVMGNGDSSNSALYYRGSNGVDYQYWTSDGNGNRDIWVPIDRNNYGN